MTESSENLRSLRAYVASELRMPSVPGVEWLAYKLAATHGETVLGVLFYGSCLRADSDDGIMDFWVIVDDYRAAYSKQWHAGISRVAPPNVFYVEHEFEGRTLRTKYGVIDRSTFERGTSFDAWHPYIWARFAQPAHLIACRDEAAREFFIKSLADSILVMVGRLVCFLTARDDSFRFSLAALWQEAFSRTYDSERRPEAEDGIRGLYLYDPKRYDTVAAYALQHLASIGHFKEVIPHSQSFQVTLAESAQRKARIRWRLMRVYGRFLALVRLAKTALTFGDWVPYVLWKLERHTGRRIDLSERQRKYPLIFAWPIILPLLLRRNLR